MTNYISGAPEKDILVQHGVINTICIECAFGPGKKLSIHRDQGESNLAMYGEARSFHIVF